MKQERKGGEETERKEEGRRDGRWYVVKGRKEERGKKRKGEAGRDAEDNL